MQMPPLSQETILIFAIFVVVIFVLYKFFKTVAKTVIIGIAGFCFPFIVNYLNLPIPLNADIQTGLQFAALAIGIFLMYTFAHFIIYFLKMILWPFKALLKRK